jgi:diguanylate cyclase (GGDEF)-like protein/PAS domain S-box-containing protein
LFSIFALSLLGLAIVSSITSAWFASNQMRDRIINESLQVAENFAEQSLLALIYDSADNAQDAANAALSFPGVNYIRLINKENIVLLNKGDVKNETLQTVPKEYKSSQAQIIYESYNAWHFVAPVYTPSSSGDGDDFFFLDEDKEKEFMGSVYIVVGKTALNRIQSTIFVTNLGIAFLITAIIIFFLHTVLKRITKPLDSLSDTMLKAQQGDHQVKAELKGPQEIVHIASVFNEMITALAERQDALFKEKEQALITLESIADGVITTDIKGQVIYLNPVAERLTGWFTEEINGRELDEIFQIFNEQNREKEKNPILICLQNGWMLGAKQHCMYRPRMGSEIFVEDTVALTRDKDGIITGAVMVFHDVSEARDMAQKLNYQATHDSLTGLINRTYFERYLVDILERIDEETEHALCYLDLDQFKVINDTCGHMAGDQLLQNISELLSHRIRKTEDTLARIGGDEFVLLLENCPLDQANKIAKSMCEAVQDYRFVWKENPFTVGISIGVVPLNIHSHDFQDVLSKADSACYMAKEKGRNRVHTYLVDDEELMQRQSEMHVVSSITEAYENDLFQLFYQPIVPIDQPENTTQHYELLLRMRDKKGHWLPPGFFLPAAERYNLVHKVDRWVIRTALNWLARHPDHLEQLQCCAINLSGMSLNDELLFEFIVAQFEATGVPNEKICFEITETAAITNLAKAIGFINQLRDLGCKSALDDFGSGMSSFAYLKNFPIDYLKIDGMFVRDIISDPIDNAMVKSINDIGHVLGLKTIAEFVEDQAIYDRLKDLGIDEAQGYHIAKPQPIDQLLVNNVSESLPENVKSISSQINANKSK